MADVAGAVKSSGVKFVGGEGVGSGSVEFAGTTDCLVGRSELSAFDVYGAGICVVLSLWGEDCCCVPFRTLSHGQIHLSMFAHGRLCNVLRCQSLSRMRVMFLWSAV